MDDEVDAEGRRSRHGSQPLLDFIQPFTETLTGALVERRESTKQSRLAATDDKVRSRHKEHRRNDGWNGQPLFEACRKRQNTSSSSAISDFLPALIARKLAVA